MRKDRGDIVEKSGNDWLTEISVWTFWVKNFERGIEKSFLKNSAILMVVHQVPVLKLLIFAILFVMGAISIAIDATLIAKD